MTTLTTGALAAQVLKTTLLAVEDLTRRLTLPALEAVQHPEHSPRGRATLMDLNDTLGQYESELGVYGFMRDEA